MNAQTVLIGAALAMLLVTMAWAMSRAIALRVNWADASRRIFARRP